MSINDKTLGRVSMILNMIAAYYIAAIPETIFSTIAWSIYVVGATTGIIHLRRLNDKPTMQMYIIWLSLDGYAIFRFVSAILGHNLSPIETTTISSIVILCALIACLVVDGRFSKIKNQIKNKIHRGKQRE